MHDEWERRSRTVIDCFCLRATREKKGAGCHAVMKKEIGRVIDAHG